MKRFILGILIICSMCAWAESPKHEFRALWVTTAWNNDWPSSSGLSANKQKEELCAIIDKVHAANFNAVFLQVRSFSDAFYKSSYEPWSYYLTGTRGKDPGYDPLQYAIEYAHKKGIELHAWVNPYRYSSSTYNYGRGVKDYATTNPGWIMRDPTSGNEYMTILNPGIPAVRQRIADVIAEIVTNYDVDGVVFDDYFYLNGVTQDSDDNTYYNNNNPKNLNRADWRRDQVNQMVALVHKTIKDIKPYVRFGISPAGVACTSTTVANKYGVDRCAVGTSDWQYDGIYSDPLAWLSSGTIDYISPQIYWKIGATPDYDALAKWWSTVAHKFGRHFYTSHTLSSLETWGDEEYTKQVALNRKYDKNGAPGSIFFNTKAVMNSTTLLDYLETNAFPSPAFPPAMTWETGTTMLAPTNLQISGSTLSWSHDKADRFTVYAYAKGTDKETALANANNLLGIVYGKKFDISGVTDLGNTTIAVRAYDRYGKEWEAALYNAETSGTDNPDPDPTTPDATYGSVKFYYQGGKLDVPADNNALWIKMWEEFKVKYPSLDYNSASFVTPVMTDLSLGASETSIGRFLKNNFVDNANKLNATANDYTLWTTGTGIWKWLGDYFQVHISSIFTGSDYSKSLNLSFETQGFLQQKAALGYGNYPKGDWTEKGKPASWQPTYIFTHRPTKEGDTFLGWFDNAKGNGSALTTLPTTGNVYACWKSNVATDVESIENATAVYLTPTFNGVEIFFTGTQSVAIYNMNGMQVAGSVSTDYYACDLQTGVYIIRVGHTIHKFIR